MRRLQPTLALALPAALAACTTFSSVRSAAPSPGFGVHTQASMSTPPGDMAAWLWSFDCAFECDHPVLAGEALVVYGLRGPDPAAAPLTLGVGINGLTPEVEVYWRVGRSASRPYGVGARVGAFDRAITGQLFGRADVTLARDVRLLWNPGVFLHDSRSPNGMNHGRFAGLVQGLGLDLGEGAWRFTPSATYVLGRTERVSYGRRFDPVTRGFVAFALGASFESRRR